MERLRAYRVRVAVDNLVSSGRRVDQIRALRERCIEEIREIAATLAVDVAEGDIIIEPIPEEDGDLLLRYRAKWAPQMGAVELRGGPKDGLVIHVPSWRNEIVYRVLAPNWREFTHGDPDALIPKIELVYRLAGYDEENRRYYFEECSR